MDLQSASASTISRRLLMPSLVAKEILAARPLPQNLAQVGSPRILALPSVLLKLMVKERLVCVTPAPMDAGGAGWRWATPAGGAVVTRDGFSLIVPPGRITDFRGDYISVTPLADENGVLPHAAYHIAGNWTSGGAPVAVQGPWIGEATDAPAVFHNSTDRGLTVSSVMAPPCQPSILFRASRRSLLPVRHDIWR